MDSIINNYEVKEYLDHYGDLKILHREIVEKQIMGPFISYSDAKSYYPVQVIVSEFQVDQKSPNKIELFQEHRGNPPNARIFSIVIRNSENKVVSYGNKIERKKVFWMDNNWIQKKNFKKLKKKQLILWMKVCWKQFKTF